MASVMASLENITWERLLAEDAVTYPCDEPDKPGSEILFAQKIVTPSGRAKIDPMGKIPKFKSSAARVEVVEAPAAAAAE